MPQNPIKKRILELTARQRGLQAQLSKMLGHKSASISEMLKKPGDPPLKYVEAVSKLTGRRVDWILTGQGPEMILNVEQGEGAKSTDDVSGKSIPFFDAIATAGMSLAQEHQDSYAQSYETVNTGTLFRDASAAMRVYGDSMFPKYQAGCMIALKEIVDKDQIVFGEDYVIETSEQRVLKRLLKSEKGDEYIELNSINPQTDSRGRQIYGSKDLHLDKIRRIYKVLGQVRYEMGGDAIMHRSPASK
jgi:phage repressor protein C with HTH and peptisase S24 domain